MTGRTIILSTVIWLLGAAGVYGQLSAADIEALRERGKRESWTFEVGPSRATKRPLHQLCGARPPDKEPEAAPYPVSDSLLAAFNWANHCTLPDVRSQGACASCGAHATIGAMECNFAIRQPGPFNNNFSEQWLISCTPSGNCVGGGGLALSFIQWGGDLGECDQNGAMYEWSFPYVALDVPCNCNPNPYAPAFWIDTYGYAGSHNDIDSIKQAILDHGPVAASIDVNDAFHAYAQGVFNACEDATASHNIILLGWDDNLGANGVWILRNSWGGDWGVDPWGVHHSSNDNGYMLIEYGCLHVGDYAYWVERSPKVWVDFGYAGTQDGGYSRPYNTLGGALAVTGAEWTIRMKPGSTSERPTIAQPVRLEAVGGAVVIGE